MCVRREQADFKGAERILEHSMIDVIQSSGEPFGADLRRPLGRRAWSATNIYGFLRTLPASWCPSAPYMYTRSKAYEVLKVYSVLAGGQEPADVNIIKRLVYCVTLGPDCNKVLGLTLLLSQSYDLRSRDAHFLLISLFFSCFWSK